MRSIHTRAAILFLLSAGLVLAQTPKPVQNQHTQTAGNPAVQVFVTAKGKTYHTWRDCLGLSHSSHVLESNEARAQQHGLTLCWICAHRHHVESKNENWAKPEVSK